jgi:very-short-patch-repair endonuclease
LKQRTKTPAQILLSIHLREIGFQNLRAEFRFCPSRQWKADWLAVFANVEYLFECDGGKFTGGHRRGQALEDDYERQNWANVNGFILLRFTNEQILNGQAQKWLKEFVCKT